MATTSIAVDCKLFRMMSYLIILKVRKFHQPTANHFSTARIKPVGGTMNRVNNEKKIKDKVTLQNMFQVGMGVIFW